MATSRNNNVSLLICVLLTYYFYFISIMYYSMIYQVNTWAPKYVCLVGISKSKYNLG